MLYVIGSGPAGVSVATALIEKGYEVTMIDPGYNLDQKRKKIIQRLKSSKKSAWKKADLAQLKSNMNPGLGGLALKSIYGSDYPYQGMDKIQPIKQINTKMIRTLARGGLSSVWGASILPFRQEDIEDWPITISELTPHYQKVLSFMAHARADHGLPDLLPCQKINFQSYCLSRQAAGLLSRLKENEKELNEDGIFFSTSQLAVNFNGNSNNPACNYCGMCLYGCPLENIYSAADTLDNLLESENFNYCPDILVEKISQIDNQVRIEALNLSEKKKVEFTGAQAFLAAGLLSSTRIILNSLGCYNHFLELKHSDQFQLPLLSLKKYNNPIQEELHTLSQLNFEILDQNISKHLVHLQTYSYNDLYKQVFEQLLGQKGAGLLNWPIKQLLSRLLIIKGYLHSDISGIVKLAIEPGINSPMILKGETNPEANRVLKKIIKKLARNKKNLGMIPVSLLTKIGTPGSGNHSGGSFPMSRNPNDFQTDTLGRPNGFTKLHIVDSTILPGIPATTITLTIMANAHRIGHLFDQ
jgi:choline dehydrogenase-like flavoprotein